MHAMIQTRQNEASGVTAHPVLFESIAALAQRASIETSAKNLAEIDAYPTMVAAGTDVYVAWVPGFPHHHIVSLAKRLRHAGLNPVPHIAARELASESVAAEFLARLREEAAVTRALVIAGLHFFAFGGFAQSARWINNTAAGRFRFVDADESFSINNDDYAKG
jgi:hypothetical protein